MSLQEETKAPSNKGVIIFGISFGIIGIIILAIVGSLFLGAPDVTTEPDNSNVNSSEDPLSQKSIPALGKFAVMQQPNSFTANVTFILSDFPDNIYVEYRIENDAKKVLAEGIVRNGVAVNEEVQLSVGDTQVALQLRASDANNYTNWQTVEYGDVSVPEGDTTSDKPVNDSYFTTSWALKEDSSPEALEVALQAAYGIERVTQVDYCAYGNQDDINVGEIFPPNPVAMDPYILKFDYMQKTNSSYTVYYYWCQ